MYSYTPAKPAKHIPVIDLAGSFSGDLSARERVAQEIHNSAREPGFFYIRNHGIEQRQIDSVFREAKRFFDLPLERKLAVHMNKSPCMRGYEPLQAQRFSVDLPGDLKESFYMGPDLGPEHPYVQKKIPYHGQNQWPEDFPGFSETLETYFSRLLDLGRHLMSLLALSLSLKEDYFADAVRNPAALLRLIHYPPHPADASIGQFGAGAHTDFGGITILAQDDCGGLEVQNAAGDWIQAKPIPNTFVINLGDMVKRWTNEFYHSSPHRVLNNTSGRDRYSIPLFFNPDYLTHIECVPTCLPASGKPKYASCTAGEHIAEMIRNSYAKSGIGKA